MPPVNHAALASVGIIAASVAVAAAIAIYESPEVRRAAENLRRRIALAFQSLGEDANHDTPRFNRPEDAHGFYESNEFDADEETRRRQREELMYWNRRRELEREVAELNMRDLEEQRQREMQQSTQRPRGATFDDFLQLDRAGDSGTYVYNSGANAWDTDSSNILRRRGNGEGARGLNAAILTNPFSDEYGIELDDTAETLPPPRDMRMSMSDIYNATPRPQSPVQPSLQNLPAVPLAPEVLFDFNSHTSSATAQSEHASAGGDNHPQPQHDAASTSTRSSTTLDRDLADDEYMTAGQDYSHHNEVYASIQAWAQNSSSHHAHNTNTNNNSNGHSNTSFYSPLPSTPRVPVSEPEIISEGQLTPTDTTDSMSVAESGVDVAREVPGYGVAAGEAVRDYDVMSDSTEGSGEGVNTPGSWSEVGSVVSEEEGAVHA
ncbi:hypothetical protein N0V88_002958 [Collariella sp. IMI 366227]|nr:hypothetical protein N0V88_002958 [Collariella sp. IMI 366227]